MSERLLIVDDDEFFVSIITIALEQSNYQLENASNGEIAWNLLTNDPDRFELVLLDKQMPHLDGIALLKRIRADLRFKDLPVIMLTGDKNEEDIAECLAAGAYYYLIKPTSDVILHQVIRSALNEFKNHKNLKNQLHTHAAGLELISRAEFSCRTLSEAKDLALILANASRDPERTLNGYVELLINAIEHGNLEISYADKSRLLQDKYWEQEIAARLKQPRFASRQVTVVMEKTDQTCVVTIRDQGKGFDWKPYLEFCPVRAFHLHGRGIAMSNALHFDQLEYLGNGNTVVTVVNAIDSPQSEIHYAESKLPH